MSNPVKGRVLCLMIMVGAPFYNTNVTKTPVACKYVVDRFEGDTAVLLLREDETIEKLIAKKDLYPSISEGDILLVTMSVGGKVIKTEFLKDETKQARKRVFILLNDVKNK